MTDLPSGSDLYGATFACVCGRTHTIQPNTVAYAPHVAQRLPDILESASTGRRVAVIMDRRTRMVAGDDVADALAEGDWEVTCCIVPEGKDGASPVCDDTTQAELNRCLGEMDVLVAVGSGVLSDLTKWIAWERNLPYVACGTAASMNGYASANIAPSLKGVKSILYAQPPSAIVADPHVICNAPHTMTASGLGDILAKSVSALDWQLNHLVCGDYYCPHATGLIAEIEPLYLDHPEGLRDHEPGGMEALFRGLLLTGVAMTMAETSAPSSGGEHMISHTLDMMSTVDGTPHDLHGRQVGVGTILAAALYERVVATASPVWLTDPPPLDTAFWGWLAPHVAEEYNQKPERWHAMLAALRDEGRWEDVRQALAPSVRPAVRVRDCLRTADGAWQAEHLGCDRTRLLTALQHAHEIRGRFTILDLAWLTGVLPGAAPELIEEWG